MGTADPLMPDSALQSKMLHCTGNWIF